MNLQAMTPVEIDSSLAETGNQVSAKEESIRRLRLRAENVSSDSSASAAQKVEFAAAIADLEAALVPLVERIELFDAEFARRGGWTRYYVVGHLHTSLRCSSFRASTRVGWLPEYSGRDESEMIELAGNLVCTLCVPGAPTEPKRPSIPVLAEAWDKAHNQVVCPGSGQPMNRDLPFRAGYVYGNWATCPECDGRVGFTSISLLRKHKPASN